MIFACVLFAAMATCVGLAHRADPGLSPWWTSVGRASVNALVVAAVARFDAPTLAGDGRRSLWVRGVIGGIGMVAYLTAIHRTSAGEAAFLAQTGMVWVLLASPWVLGEWPSRRAWLAVGGSLVGVALLAWPRDAAGDALGRGLGLVAGLTTAGANLSIRVASRTNGPTTIVWYFTAVATVVSLSGVVVSGAPPPAGAATWVWVIGAGLFAAFAQLQMTQAFGEGDASLVTAAGATSPLFTAIAGAWVLGQRPDAAGVAGMALLGVTAVVLPFLRR